MKISLCSVPVEPDYVDLTPTVSYETDVLSPSIRSEGQLPVMPKIAVVSLIQWMEKHGYARDDYDFYDIDMLIPSDKELEDYFSRLNPAVVGLSAVVSTCYYQVRRISKIIRRACPDAWIVMGGSLTASANLVLRKTAVDICVVGDGEIAWIKFLDYVKKHGRQCDYKALEQIQGLAYLGKDGGLCSTGYGESIPAEDNPFPDYEILKLGLKDHPEALQYYFRIGLKSTHFQTDPRSHEKRRRPYIADIWSSKGCVARCTFCQRSTKGYRVPAVDALDGHLALLKEKFNVGFIHILDENFGSNKEYAYQLAEIMQKHDMLWMASGVRVSTFEYEDFKFFKEHGCASLKFGVETGSQKIMNVMEKKFTVERVYQTLKHMADLEMYSPLAVMVGMPGETLETAAATGQFLGRLAHMQGIEPEYLGVCIFYALPLCGTPLYVYGQQVGVIGKSPDEEEKFLLSVSGTGASKVNYINLNGAPIREALFWDWLVKLEMSRTFYELERKQPIDRTKFIYKIVVSDKTREIVGSALTFREIINKLKAFELRGIRGKLFYGIDNFLERHVVFSRFVHRFPRWFVCGMVQNLVHLQYLCQKIVLKILGREFNLFKRYPAVKRLEVETKPSFVQVASSLRTVVKERDLPALKLKTQAEQYQDVLAIGL